MLQGFSELVALAIDHCLRRPEVIQNWNHLLSRWKDSVGQTYRSPSNVVTPPKTISANTLDRIREYLRAAETPVLSLVCIHRGLILTLLKDLLGLFEVDRHTPCRTLAQLIDGHFRFMGFDHPYL